jgi:small subunit ribosomal protein S6
MSIRRDIVNNYELICVFNTKENHYAEGVEVVRALLQKQELQITKEEDMGNRTLAYSIKKEERGHYHLYAFTHNGTLTKFDDLLKLQKELLRHMIIRIDEPRKYKARVRKTTPIYSSSSSYVAPPAANPVASEVTETVASPTQGE